MPITSAKRSSQAHQKLTPTAERLQGLIAVALANLQTRQTTCNNALHLSPSQLASRLAPHLVSHLASLLAPIKRRKPLPLKTKGNFAACESQQWGPSNPPHPLLLMANTPLLVLNHACRHEPSSPRAPTTKPLTLQVDSLYSAVQLLKP